MASRNSFWSIQLNISITLLVMAIVSTGLTGGGIATLTVVLSTLPGLMITTFQLIRREREIFHPLLFLHLTILFGVTIQSAYLVYFDDGTHRFSLGRIVDGQSLLVGVSAICLGVFFLLLGFSKTGRTSVRSNKNIRTSVNEKRVIILSFICLLIGGASLLYYASVFSVLDNLATQFSVKRRFVSDQTGISSTLTWVRFGVNFCQLAFFISYATYLRSNSGNKKLLGRIAFIACLAGVVLPFIASSRLGLITFLLGGAMIHHFSTNGWSVKRLQGIGVFVLLTIMVMGGLRYAQTRSITLANYMYDTSITQMVEPIVGSSNFLAIGKTSAVIEGVPTVMDFEYGRTYLLWLIAPIPRSMWEDKPIVRIGAEVGAALFGTTLRGGVPPGVIGELFLNFGWLGIPTGMLVFGLFLGLIHTRYGLRAYSDFRARVIYSSVIVFLAFSGPSSDFTGMIGMTLQRLVPLLLMLAFVCRKSVPLRLKRAHSAI